MPTKIDWCDETVNFITFGKIDDPRAQRRCFGCIYCYVEPFKKRYEKNFEEGIHLGRLKKLKKWKKKSVFLDSTFDICHPAIQGNGCLEQFFSILKNEVDASNTLIFLTKNPKVYREFISKDWIPENTYFGITLETDTYEFQKQKITGAPDPRKRVEDFADLFWKHKFISIEPIMKYSSRSNFLDLIESIKNLSVVIIGGNTNRRVKLVEPPLHDLVILVGELSRRYKLIMKQNVSRLGLIPKLETIKVNS